MANSGRGKGRNRGCLACLGCLGVMGILAIVLVAAVLFAPDLLRKVGILGMAPEERFSGAIDPAGTQAVTEVLDRAGFENADVVVLPVKGTDKQVAFITIDDSSVLGNLDTDATGQEQFISLIQDISQANQENDLNIDAVAMNVTGENGESLLTVGVPQSAIDAYAAGEISRREFVSQVEIDVDIDLTTFMNAEEREQFLQGMEAGQ